MKALSDIFQKKDIAKEFFKHPWQKSLDEISKRINYDLAIEGYKPWPHPRIAKRIKEAGWINTMDDLGWLVKQVQQATYPAKKFFILTKKK